MKLLAIPLSLWLGLSLMPPLAVATETPAQPAATAAEAAFERLSTLVGNWSVADRDLEISFELIANDTVLVETWTTRGQKRSLTLYHRDGDRLLATHYCPQGNQPRLVFQPGPEAHDLSFTFLDATNLPDPDQSHQFSLGFDFTDPEGRVSRSETYLAGGEASPSSLILERSGGTTQ